MWHARAHKELTTDTLGVFNVKNILAEFKKNKQKKNPKKQLHYKYSIWHAHTHKELTTDTLGVFNVKNILAEFKKNKTNKNKQTTTL